MLNLNLNKIMKDLVLKRKIYLLSLFMILLKGNRIQDEYQVDTREIATLKTYGTKIYTGKRHKTSENVIVKVFENIDRKKNDILEREESFSKCSDGEHIPLLLKTEYVYKHPGSSDVVSIKMAFKCSGNITLENYIGDKYRFRSMNYIELLEFLREILIGLEHLSRCGKALGNLNIGNILTNENKEIYFSDCELTTCSGNTQPITQKNIEKQKDVIDPEIIKDFRPSLPGDIYSFGIIMSQLMKKCNYNYSDTKSAKIFITIYDKIRESCLKKDLRYRTDINSLLNHELFNLLIPEFYEFSQLDNFSVKTREYDIIKDDNTILFSNSDVNILIVERQTSGLINSIAIKNPKDFIFIINGKSTIIEYISSQNIDYIDLMLDCIKNVALSSDPPLKIDDSGRQKLTTDYGLIK